MPELAEVGGSWQKLAEADRTLPELPGLAGVGWSWPKLAQIGTNAKSIETIEEAI